MNSYTHTLSAIHMMIYTAVCVCVSLEKGISVMISAKDYVSMTAASSSKRVNDLFHC